MPAPKDPEKYALYIERLRQSHRGKKHTPEQRAKIGKSVSAAKAGKPRPDMRGENALMRRPGVAAKVGAAHRGKPKSAEHREKIASSLRGQYSGKANGNWRGSEAGYMAVHRRATQILPHQCAHCGTTAGRLTCALRQDAPTKTIRVDRSGLRFSVANPPDVAYIRLCARCHSRYDARKRKN